MPFGNQSVHTQATIVSQHTRHHEVCVTAMASIDTVPAFQARLALYRIDDQTRSLLAQTWPTIAPHLDRVIDDVVMAITELPHIGKAVAQNQALVKKLEVAHFQALLGGQ